jgi:hypothetical protein
VTPTSFQVDLPAPAAVVSNGLVTVPLWAVSSLTLNETQDLPATGGDAQRSQVSRPTGTLSMAAVLVGSDRFAWKLALESLAHPQATLAGRAASAFAGAVSQITGLDGLVVLTSVAVSANMHLTNLTFSVSAARRDVIDVSLSFVRMPVPAPLGTLLDAAGFAIRALGMWEGG